MDPSSLELLALHGLRLKGFAPTETLAPYVGRPVDVVERQLQQAGDDGHTVFRQGARAGWTLTAEGRKEGERLLAEELDDVQGLRAHVTDAHARFRALNPELLQICTDWQVLDVENNILNDHSDDERDAAIVARLGHIDRQVQPVAATLDARLARFASYRPRFANALSRVGAGDTEWFTKPTIDSYHTVWFELHEDLLATLGLDRTSEQQST